MYIMFEVGQNKRRSRPTIKPTRAVFIRTVRCRPKSSGCKTESAIATLLHSTPDLLQTKERSPKNSLKPGLFLS